MILFFFKDCQTLLNGISEGLTRLAMIHSENSNADNQLNLANLHNRYDNPELSFSQESRHTFEDDLAKVEYIIEYFKKQKNKQGICKEWFIRNNLFQSITFKRENILYPHSFCVSSVMSFILMHESVYIIYWIVKNDGLWTYFSLFNVSPSSNAIKLLVTF